MRAKPIIMIVLALCFGGSAILAGKAYLQRQLAQQQPVAAAQPAVPTTTIVVAASPLRFGDELTSRSLREIPWPQDAVPAGAFRTKAEVLKAGDKRIALAPMEANEPVLKAKITGEGQRATLSALLDDGMGAVTIEVDEVVGLAGFVLPGDRVDVFATQKPAGGDDGPQGVAYNERVLQNVRVLAVGQLADERSEKPAVVKAVTIEVDPAGAQKVALAARTATLSLMLRKAGETMALASRRIAADEIGENTSGDAGNATRVQVTRGMARTTYAVPRLGTVSDTQPSTLARDQGTVRHVVEAQ